MPSLNTIHWTEAGTPCSGRWRSERTATAPAKIVVADDRMTADEAYRLAAAGTAMLWRGDFQNARQLLQALSRRVDRKTRHHPANKSLTAAFHRQREAQARRAELLGMVLIPLDADYRIPLRRAPDVAQACREAWGEATADDLPSIVSLRELQGLIGAHEWRRKGVEIPALAARIHPHYGVFSPIRGEYLDLVATAPLTQLPSRTLAFDIGTGTGVLAALLVKRGLEHIIATDRDPRALCCARENLARLGIDQRVDVVDADLFPPGRAPLIVCNPPWLPGQPSAGLEHAIYDPASQMLRGFLDGLGAHLEPGGEGWLILSDLAEHLGLRRRDELATAIANAGLRVIARMDIRPRHSRAMDTSDPLHTARAAEVTSLWRLAATVASR
jgi:methylase of polypeptide subunit release factors